MGDQPADTFDAAPIPTGEAPEVTVIVPCFNEEEAIGSTIDELRRHLASESHEIVVVDDGSTDDSRKVLDGFRSDPGSLRIIHHERNLGYGAALKSGIRNARADIVAITDADGTYPNARLMELLRHVEAFDMVVGARVGDIVAQSRLRQLPKVFLRWYASWITRRNIPDLNSGFRVFRKSVAERFLSILPDGFSFTSTITVAMLTNHYSVRFVPIDYSPRIGRSKIRPIHDTMNFIQLIVRTGMYFAPLRILFPFAVLLGLGFVASLAYDVFFLKNLTDKTVVLLMFCMNTVIFGLLADMIDKRIIR